jgi:hypothetical protein
VLGIVLAPPHISWQEYEKTDDLKCQMTEETSQKDEASLVLNMLGPISFADSYTNPHETKHKSECYGDVECSFFLISFLLDRYNSL